MPGALCPNDPVSRRTGELSVFQFSDVLLLREDLLLHLSREWGRTALGDEQIWRNDDGIEENFRIEPASRIQGRQWSGETGFGAC